MILTKTNTWTFGITADPSKITVVHLGGRFYLINGRVFGEYESYVRYLDGVDRGQNAPMLKTYDILSKSMVKYLYPQSIDKATRDQLLSYITYDQRKLSLEDLIK